MVRVDSPRVYRDKKAWIDIKVPARPIPVHKVSTSQEEEEERERVRETYQHYSGQESVNHWHCESQ